MSKTKKFEIEIHYTKAADKFFNKHQNVRKKYEDAIIEVLTGDHPEKVNLKRIQGTDSTYYRIRLGNYRVIYTIINNKIVVVLTLLAGARGDIYNKTGRLK